MDEVVSSVSFSPTIYKTVVIISSSALAPQPFPSLWSKMFYGGNLTFTPSS